MAYNDKINDKNLWSTYKLIIQTGTADLLIFPERKETLSNDWSDENGVEYDLGAVKLKDKEVQLQCVFITDTDAQFWTSYNAFFAEMTKVNTQNLYIDDHGKTYAVFYKKTSNFKKVSKRLKGVSKVVVKFTLVIQVI